jgi:hypothetical protein
MSTFRKTWRVASVFVLGLSLTAACSSSSPSSPSSSNNPNAPRIVALAPNTPTASAAAQTITVTGERFSSGMSALFDAPNGAWTTYATSVQSPTSLTVTVMLDRAGVWDLTVKSADGLESNEVQFNVVAGTP